MFKLSTKLEIILGLALILILGFVWYVHEGYAVDRARAEERIAALETQKHQSDEQIKTATEQLREVLKQLDQVKQRVQTPTQVIREIPQYINQPLPQPITYTLPEPTKENPHPEPVSANVPAADLKPIFDSLVEGKQCKEELNVCQGTVQLKETQIVATEKQLAEEKKIAKGGGFFNRLGRAAKYVGIGIAVGFGIAHGL